MTTTLEVEADATGAGRGGGDRDERGPCYEFRVFGAGLDAAAAVLEAKGAPALLEASIDRYIVVPGSLGASLKIRNGILELKLLRARHGAFELWDPVARGAFPIAERTLAAHFLRDAGIVLETGRRSYPDAATLCDDVSSLPHVRVVPVRKLRRRYAFGGGLAELTRVQVGDRAVRTVAVEADDEQVLARMVARLGIGGSRNTSYPRYLAEHSAGSGPVGAASPSSS